MAKTPTPLDKKITDEDEPSPQEDASKAPVKKDLHVASNGWFFLFFFFGLAIGIGFVLWALSEQLRQTYPTLFVGNIEGGRVRAKNQVEDAFGWGSELLVDKKPNQPAKIRFLLRDKNKRPVTGAQISVTFTAKGDSKQRFTFAFVSDEPGVYRAEAPLPMPATWEVRVSGIIGENAYQTSEEITLP